MSSEGYERGAYLPDSLTLEADGWAPCPTGNPAWVKQHPAKPEYGCRLWPDYSTGRLRLAEHEKREQGQRVAPGLTKFNGFVDNKNEFQQLLRMVRWLPSE